LVSDWPFFEANNGLFNEKKGQYEGKRPP